MALVCFKIPEARIQEVSKYISDLGGTKVVVKKSDKTQQDEDKEVTHGVFFGENIKRLIEAFKK